VDSWPPFCSPGVGAAGVAPALSSQEELCPSALLPGFPAWQTPVPPCVVAVPGIRHDNAVPSRKTEK